MFSSCKSHAVNTGDPQGPGPFSASNLWQVPEQPLRRTCRIVGRARLQETGTSPFSVQNQGGSDERTTIPCYAAVLTIAISGLAVRAGVPAAAAGGPQDAAIRDDQVRTGASRSTTPSLALVRDVREFALAGGRVGPAVHGHRGHGESGHGALPLADRPFACQRPRAELRVRPARARQAAAQVRRPRGDADPHAHGKRHDRSRRR